ncbi:hypothetical protein MVES1_003210a [Malassezia vespertilionis]|uniref:Phosphatidyl-N-methylethanolamine N-methyltransferase n=1 Tax=Malassezia vespertilionis TaxID=2020962 RepID=A0A2N1J9N0_9BASI|nr:uncharacterized protein MVES1_003210a [Malassezia vespertilionis]PKI83261.1 Opi3p [Malassezia vespertilionis]WFD07843.1 hypothetical protein MVES1_003210a [Malassezia vespertilionis]
MANLVKAAYEHVFAEHHEVTSVVFNPTFWNVVAQNGCYLLAVSIFSLGLLRDALYNHALLEQPTAAVLLHPAVRILAVVLFTAGNVFVLTSMYALGVTGTYLGDYFGILMDHMVTSFPFSVVADPMYVGSSMSFTAVALWRAKPAGLVLSVVVMLAYAIGMRYEGPFTAMIYREAAAQKNGSNTSGTPKSIPTTPAKSEKPFAAQPVHAYGTRSQSRRRI